jgi:hypothetical protein
LKWTKDWGAGQYFNIVGGTTRKLAGCNTPRCYFARVRIALGRLELKR